MLSNMLPRRQVNLLDLPLLIAFIAIGLVAADMYGSLNDDSWQDRSLTCAWVTQFWFCLFYCSPRLWGASRPKLCYAEYIWFAFNVGNVLFFLAWIATLGAALLVMSLFVWMIILGSVIAMMMTIVESSIANRVRWYQILGMIGCLLNPVWYVFVLGSKFGRL